MVYKAKCLADIKSWQLFVLNAILGLWGFFPIHWSRWWHVKKWNLTNYSNTTPKYELSMNTARTSQYYFAVVFCFVLFYFIYFHLHTFILQALDTVPFWPGPSYSFILPGSKFSG